ncbi:MAG: glycosyltransferase [Alphaproteobacteria bacterium]
MSKDKRVKVSIVVPSYNETIEVKRKAIEEIDNFFKKQNYSYEVVIVDDGSTNNTLPEVKNLIEGRQGFRLIENEHSGKAITVMTGLLNSRGDIAIFTDMDQATPIYEIDKLMPKFNAGFDVVIGSRKGRKGAPLTRKLAAWGFSVIRTIFLGLPFKDTQCGFKAFNRKSIELIFPQLLNRWKAMKAKGAAVNAGFDVEVLFLAKKNNLKIAEVAVEWHHVENLKQVHLLNDSLEALKDILRIRWNDLKGEYDLS